MIIGHEKIIDDLKGLASNRRLTHGYVFFGPAMVGKRLVAQGFANFLETGNFAKSFDYAQGKPRILSDALVIEPDEKGIVGIDSVRAIKNFLWQRPNVSTHRTVIIDDAEFMTPEAQNALLKVAEEPPHSTLLILITSDIDGLVETISSRLQKIYFSAVPPKLVEKWAEKEFAGVKNLDNFIGRSFGKPGLLSAMIRDQKFQAVLKSAETLLKLRGDGPASLASENVAGRRDFLKKLLAPDDFNLSKFLDALIIVISAEAPCPLNFLGAKTMTDINSNAQKVWRVNWHKFLQLRRDAARFNLNPRLQLENLFMQN